MKGEDGREIHTGQTSLANLSLNPSFFAISNACSFFKPATGSMAD